MNEDDKELMDGLDDDDDEDIVFGDDSDEELEESDEDTKSKTKRSKKGQEKGDSSLFASAEEFASLLEDEGSSKVAPGGSNAFANKDRAAQKQLDWEDKRNQWLTGYNRAMGKGKKGGSGRFNNQKGKNFGQPWKKNKK